MIFLCSALCSSQPSLATRSLSLYVRYPFGTLLRIYNLVINHKFFTYI
jgi:hypothetical protein